MFDEKFELNVNVFFFLSFLSVFNHNRMTMWFTFIMFLSSFFSCVISPHLIENNTLKINKWEKKQQNVNFSRWFSHYALKRHIEPVTSIVVIKQKINNFDVAIFDVINVFE